MSVLQESLSSAVVAAVPLLLVALGELMSERVGVLNIGLEGIMLVGAAAGFIIAIQSDSILVGLLGGTAAGAVFNLVFFAVPVLLLRTSQVLAGFALWLVGVGLSAQLGSPYADDQFDLTLSDTSLPLLHDLPFVGPVFFVQTWPVYVSVLLALGAAFLIAQTRHGLDMRAIGEDPAAARAVGLRVRSWQAFYCGICGALGGTGGAVLSVVVLGSFRDQMTAGRGWIALALVVAAAWLPTRLIVTAFIFGGLLVLADIGQAHGWGIPSPILSMSPYVFTLVILIARAWREHVRGRDMAAPASLSHVS